MAGSGKDHIRLLIEGKEVIRKNASGNPEQKLGQYSWDVSKWKGKEARIEIVDATVKKEQFLLLDKIEFTDARLPNEKITIDSSPGAVAKAGSNAGLDLAVLGRWVAQLSGKDKHTNS